MFQIVKLQNEAIRIMNDVFLMESIILKPFEISWYC